MSDYSDEHDDEREKSEKHSSLAESVINCDYCLPYFRRITKCVFVLHKLHIPKHVKRNFWEETWALKVHVCFSIPNGHLEQNEVYKNI